MDKSDDEIDLSGIPFFGKKKDKPIEHKSEHREHHQDSTSHKTHSENDKPAESHHENKEHNKHEDNHEKNHETNHKNDNAKHHETAKTEHLRHEKKDDEEINLDFSFMKNIFKGKKEHETKKSEEDIVVDFSQVSKYAWIILPAIFILMAVYLSVNVRMQTSDLPFTDNWARSGVFNYWRNQISSQISAQNPNLPANIKNQQVNTQFDSFYGQYKDQIEKSIFELSLQYKSEYSDEEQSCLQSFSFEKCKPYMPDIDPYYWFRYTKNIVELGHPGDIVKNGEQYDTHMLAPNGRGIPYWDTSHPYALAYLFGIIKIFNPGIDLIHSMFFYPVIVIGISTILIFFIARRLGGNVGALFAASVFAVNFALLNRTLFGHADSDSWVVFFPILATFLFLEAFEAKNKIAQIGLTILAALSLAIFNRFWTGWWYIFDFLLAALGIYIAYVVLINRKTAMQEPIKLIQNDNIRSALLVGILLVVFTAIFIIPLTNASAFFSAFNNIFKFVQIKEAVAAQYWPNVLTTVAELNPGSIGDIINNVGGKLMFLIGLCGIAASLINIKKPKQIDLLFMLGASIWYAALLYLPLNLSALPFFFGIVLPIMIKIFLDVTLKASETDIKVAVLIAIWFLGTIYASLLGIRFALLLVPAYSVSFGIMMGFIYEFLASTLPKMLDFGAMLAKASSIFILALIWILLFLPPGLPVSGSISGPAYSMARNDVPIINDAWFKSLKAIEADSKPNAIITSWWDFGHHFKSLADRPVTFDGTTQDTPQAHWVGKMLLTSDEKVAFGILRMLDCGGNNAFDFLYEKNKNTISSVKILNEIMLLSIPEAKNRLTSRYMLSESDADSLLKFTHCNPPEGYVIASEDMVGKAGVWAHFGGWNFEKAYIYQELRNKPQAEAVTYMMDNFNYSKTTAENIYFEAKSKLDDSSANGWISSWPGYIGESTCVNQNLTILTCDFGLPNQGNARLEVDLSAKEAHVLTGSGKGNIVSFSYPKNDKLITKTYTDPILSLSATLVPKLDGYSAVISYPELATSMFTRLFYLKGHGLDSFDGLSHKQSIGGSDIYVWKINWNPNGTRIIAFSQKNMVSVDYVGYLENGTVFDSSINDWQGLNVSSRSGFFTSSTPIQYVEGSGKMIPGFDLGVKNMSVGDVQVLELPPEAAYGTDPTKHPLGNKTLFFKVKLKSRIEV